MKAPPRSPDLFRVCLMGTHNSITDGQRYIDYRDAERQAVRDAKTTRCPYDVFLGPRLVATVECLYSDSTRVKIDLTPFGSQFA